MNLLKTKSTSITWKLDTPFHTWNFYPYLTRYEIAPEINFLQAKNDCIISVKAYQNKKLLPNGGGEQI